MIIKPLNRLVPLALVIMVSGRVFGHERQTTQVDITVTGIHSDRGEVVLCLFSKDDGLRNQEKVVKVIYAKINGNSATGHFADIAPDVYAISVNHDENGNKKLDRNLLGVPKKNIGTSNNGKGHFGPPKFIDAKFPIPSRLKLFRYTLYIYKFLKSIINIPLEIK